MTPLEGILLAITFGWVVRLTFIVRELRKQVNLLLIWKMAQGAKFPVPAEPPHQPPHQ